MKDSLDAGLQRPPGGHLQLVANLKDSFIIGDHESAREERVRVLLGMTQIIAQLQIGSSDSKRVPISMGDEAPVHKPPVNTEFGQVPICGRGAETEESDQALLSGVTLVLFTKELLLGEKIQAVIAGMVLSRGRRKSYSRKKPRGYPAVHIDEGTRVIITTELVAALEAGFVGLLIEVVTNLEKRQSAFALTKVETCAGSRLIRIATVNGSLGVNLRNGIPAQEGSRDGIWR